MAYARFAPDSDVYVFLDSEGAFSCCGCSISEKSPFFTTTEALLDHLVDHERNGDRVPAYCEEALIRDRVENDHWIAVAQGG